MAPRLLPSPSLFLAADARWPLPLLLSIPGFIFIAISLSAWWRDGAGPWGRDSAEGPPAVGLVLALRIASLTDVSAVCLPPRAVGVRAFLIQRIPKCIMLATAGGIGLFLTHIGLQQGEGIAIVTYNSATLVTLGGCAPQYRSYE